MAGNVQKTIDIIFNGTDNISGVLGDLESSLDSTVNSAQNLAQPFEAVTKSVLALDAVLVGLVTTGVMVSSDIENAAVKMKNALGLPTEEALKFKDIAEDVYTQGYGEDLASSFEAVTLAQQKFGDSAEVDIGRVVIAAAKLDKTFGVDYNESLGAANTLMTNFGLTSEEAFDFITKGFQDNLNGSGDFIDSITEYSTQFANGGADAGQFFSVMQSGFQEGMLGTDRAADTFKEFRVRIQDGSAGVAESLAQIGLGDEFTDSLKNGEITAIEAFGTVIQKLSETEDSSVRMQAATGLMGTQFEDMGDKAALSLNTTQTKMDDLIGTMDDFDGEPFEKNMAAAWRKAIIAVGEMSVWDDLKDRVGDIAGDIAINFADVLGDVDTKEIEQSAEELFGIFAKFFEDSNLDLTSAEGMKEAMDILTGSIETLLDVTKGMAEIAVPALNAVVDAVEYMNGLSSDTKEFVGNILALGSALGVVAGVVGVGAPFISGLSTLSGMFTTGGALATGIAGVVSILTGPAGLALALGVAGKAVYDFSLSNAESDAAAQIKGYEDQAVAVKKLTDQIKELPIGDSTIEIFTAIETGDLEAAQDLIDEIVTGEYIANIGTDIDDKPLADYISSASDIFVSVGVEADLESVKEATETISYEIDGVEYTLEIPVESSGVDQVKKDIEEIPTEKQLEITLQGDIDAQIAQIKASAETAGAAFKYKAEVDIAEAQEATKRLEATFASINASIASSAGVYDSAFGGAESDSFQARTEAIDILRQEQDLREQSFELQKKLTESQIKYQEAKTESVKSGEAAITIDSTGLEPSLEMIMWEIIQKVQVRATEEAADFLLGI